MPATTLSYGSIDLFLDSLSVNGHPANTVRAYRADLTGLLLAVGETPLTELEVRAAMYLNLERANWKPKTTLRKLTAFRKFAKWAQLPNFLAEYRGPTPAKPVPHPLPEGIAGVMAMIEACGVSRRRRALIAMTGLCGLRVGEAIAAVPSWVNLDERLLTVRGKGDKERIIPISTNAYPVLANAVQTAVIYDNERLCPYKDRWARQLISAVGVRALGHPVPSHDLRATFATSVYRATKDIRVVQELLGHSSVEQSQVYTEIAMTSMRDAVELAA